MPSNACRSTGDAAGAGQRRLSLCLVPCWEVRTEEQRRRILGLSRAFCGVPFRSAALARHPGADTPHPQPRPSASRTSGPRRRSRALHPRSRSRGHHSPRLVCSMGLSRVFNGHSRNRRPTRISRSPHRNVAVLSPGRWRADSNLRGQVV